MAYLFIISGFSQDRLTDLKQWFLPSIMHWAYSHFVDFNTNINTTFYTINLQTSVFRLHTN